MFERLHSQKNYMQIARQIRNLIRDGTLKVGQQLPPERALVEQFGASRASIREALSALEMLGLIECRSGQGNYIKADGSTGTIDGEMLRTLLLDHDPYEIFETRLELEPSMSALAAERATDEERDKLKAHVETLAALGEPDPRRGFQRRDHRRIHGRRQEVPPADRQMRPQQCAFHGFFRGEPHDERDPLEGNEEQRVDGREQYHCIRGRA